MFWDKTNFGIKKKFWIQKTNFGQKIVGPNKFLVQKKLWVQNKFWVQKNFGSKEILDQKKFWVQKFVACLNPKKDLVQKHFKPEKIVGPKILYVQKILGQKNFWSKWAGEGEGQGSQKLKS